jgi:hypothetical protein
MSFSKSLENLITLSLFIATMGALYIFIETVVYKKITYIGFYNSWQLPMLFALFIDSIDYTHLRR